MEEGRSTFKILSGKLTGKVPLGSPRRGWEDSITMDLKGIDINTGNWVDSGQNRDYWRVLVNAALNLQVPQAMELVSVNKTMYRMPLIKPEGSIHSVSPFNLAVFSIKPLLF